MLLLLMMMIIMILQEADEVCPTRLFNLFIIIILLFVGFVQGINVNDINEYINGRSKHCFRHVLPMHRLTVSVIVVP